MMNKEKKNVEVLYRRYVVNDEVSLQWEESLPSSHAISYR